MRAAEKSQKFSVLRQSFFRVSPDCLISRKPNGTAEAFAIFWGSGNPNLHKDKAAFKADSKQPNDFQQLIYMAQGLLNT